jgi:hypothetical protein
VRRITRMSVRNPYLGQQRKRLRVIGINQAAHEQSVASMPGIAPGSIEIGEVVTGCIVQTGAQNNKVSPLSVPDHSVV